MTMTEYKQILPKIYYWIWMNMTEYNWYDWIWLNMTMKEYDLTGLNRTEYD